MSDNKSASGDPYKLLNVSRDAQTKDIRKAYFLLARRVHPDRNPSHDAASAFQALQRAYGILSDPAKRRLFDKTGCTDQDSEAFWQAYQQYRTIYPEVNAEDIVAFTEKYRNSAEEAADLRAFYIEKGGDVSTLQAHIMVSRPEDAARFEAFFDEGIRSGVLERTEAYDRTKHLCGQMPEDDDLEDDDSSDEREIGDGDDDDDDDDDGMSDFIVDDASDVEDEEEIQNTWGRIEASQSCGANKRKRSKTNDSSSPLLSSASSSLSSRKKVKTKSAAAPAATAATANEGKTKPKSKSKQAGKKAQTRKSTKEGKKWNIGEKKQTSKTKKKKDNGGVDDGMDSLREMLLQRARSRHESMLDGLAAKYG